MNFSVISSLFAGLLLKNDYFRWALAFISLLVLCSISQFIYQSHQLTDAEHAAGRDFFIFYQAGKAANSGDPGLAYNSGRFFTLQQEEFGRADFNHYSYPPIYTMLMQPFSLLSYKHAYLAWICFQYFFFLVACACFLKRSQSLSYPENQTFIWHATNLLLFAGLPITILSLNWGQNGVLFAAICLFAFSLHHRPFYSGACLSLALIKPHLVFLFIAYWIGSKNHKALSGICSGSIALFALSLFTLGISPWLEYIRYILFNYQNVLSHHNEYTLSSYLHLLGMDYYTIRIIQSIILLGFALYAFMLGRKNPEPNLAFLVLAFATSIASPYFNCYDQVLACVLFLSSCLLSSKAKSSIAELLFIILVYFYSVIVTANNHTGTSPAPLLNIIIFIFLLQTHGTFLSSTKRR